jgi:SOS-response transcriptional repressor LexA/DNA-binding XRE family transcriptional regulator
MLRRSMKSRKAQSHEWSLRILALRRDLELTQAALASRLHYSAMALSRWERGTHEPPAQGYIRLGNLADKPECFWFWARAGLTGADFSEISPERDKDLDNAQFPQLEIQNIKRGKRTSNLRTARLVAIPILAAHGAMHNDEGDRVFDLDAAPADEIIAAPEAWCPNPSDTNCLRVRGNSMEPLINDGDIVAVDCAQTDPAQLSGKIVVTWQQETGLVLSRFLFVNGAQLLEGENRVYEPVPLGKSRNWRIIGRVLWWVRRAP